MIGNILSLSKYTQRYLNLARTYKEDLDKINNPLHIFIHDKFFSCAFLEQFNHRFRYGTKIDMCELGSDFVYANIYNKIAPFRFGGPIVETYNLLSDYHAVIRARLERIRYRAMELNISLKTKLRDEEIGLIAVFHAIKGFDYKQDKKKRPTNRTNIISLENRIQTYVSR